MKCDYRASLLALTFTSPCFDRELKANVVTILDHFFQVIVVSFDITMNEALFFNPSQTKQFTQKKLIARF
jgi:hypothetical protein